MGKKRSDVGSEQVGGDIAWVCSVVMWAVSKRGYIVWLWGVVMWGVSKWRRYSVGMERSDVGSKQVGRYKLGIESSDLGSEQVK